MRDGVRGPVDVTGTVGTESGSGRLVERPHLVAAGALRRALAAQRAPDLPSHPNPEVGDAEDGEQIRDAGAAEVAVVRFRLQDPDDRDDQAALRAARIFRNATSAKPMNAPTARVMLKPRSELACRISRSVSPLVRRARAAAKARRCSFWAASVLIVAVFITGVPPGNEKAPSRGCGTASGAGGCRRKQQR